jgi:hypothetical protein
MQLELLDDGAVKGVAIAIIIIIVIIASVYSYSCQLCVNQHSRSLRHSCPHMFCMSLYSAKLQAF